MPRCIGAVLTPAESPPPLSGHCPHRPRRVVAADSGWTGSARTLRGLHRSHPPVIRRRDENRRSPLRGTMSHATSPASNRRWWALGLIAAAQFVVIMDTSIIGVALPKMQTD